MHLCPPLLRPIHGSPDDSENALVILGGERDSDESATELGVADDTTLNPRISESLRTILPKAFLTRTQSQRWNGYAIISFDHHRSRLSR
jgi:hypothetical protein